MSFAKGLKGKAAKVWEEGYNHPFVQELGKGVLDKEKFKFYLLQDYLYLLQYAKVFASAAVKADTEEIMTAFTKIQYAILAEEMDLHRNYMSEFGITPEEAEKAKASLYNKTYTANMLAVGYTGSLAQMTATVLPCAWTYSDWAKRLKAENADKLENNFYKKWIATYSSDDFAATYVWLCDVLDNLTSQMSEKQLENITDIFISSVEFEYLFWEMAYNRQMSYN
ncbi:MAG: thiaminase II [Defluviitaleaceae bacterium]|nr:thiaminase II [Defluviitaleaceae bacterium]